MRHDFSQEKVPNQQQQCLTDSRENTYTIYNS